MSGNDNLDKIDMNAVRRRVEKRIKDRQEFNVHAVIYIMVNALLWVVYAILPFILDQVGLGTNDFPGNLVALPWPLLVMFGWGIGLAAHGLNVYYGSSAGEAMRERMLQREVERERARLGLEADSEGFEREKRKNDQRVRLGEDGELEYLDAEDAEAEDRPARRSRSTR